MTTHYDPYPRQAAAPTIRVYGPTRARPEYLDAGAPPDEPQSGGLRIDGLALAALVIVTFLVLQSVLDRDRGARISTSSTSTGETADSIELSSSEAVNNGSEAAKAEEQELKPLAPPPAPDPYAITYPYDEYWVTQGPHGFSYGHMAIDIAAGKGAAVKSPIHGEVTANYVDQYGNTTLIIENDVYAITLLHGNFSAQPGQKVALGEVVGSEGNNGYTTDMQGRSCRGRDCGYHSHLNVFNKLSQSNVNPLEVLQ